MKPLNSHTTGCDPVSSNCVIWQGPDIPCIKLCKGDSVSDVVYKLATELCVVLDALDVTTYDLPSACFTNQSCNPGDFHDLIQLIIYKICCIESGATDTTSCNYSDYQLPTSSTTGFRTTGASAGCPDCVVDIASCFYYTNEFGDQVTTMQLVDYTRSIGNKICTIVNEILSLTELVNNLEVRVTVLENTPPPTLILPTVTPTCVITPAVPLQMNVVLSTLEQQFCQLISATGSPTSIYQAVTKQCINLGNSPALGTSGGIMATLPGWQTTANTLSATVNNMWLTLCDLRSAVQNIQLNCCPTGCEGIEITLTALVSSPSNSITLYLGGTIPTGFTECDPVGNTFKVTDSLGNNITFKVNTPTYLNSPTGYVYSLAGTPINPAANITVTSDLCYINSSTKTTCQFCVTYVVNNVSICPDVAAVSSVSGTSATVGFIPSVIPATYTVELWNSTFTSIIGTQTLYVNITGEKSFAFTGLTPSTVYNARVIISNGGNSTECSFVPFTTNPTLCLPPSGVSANVAIPIYCETCGKALEFTDNVTEDGTYVDVTSDYLINYVSGSPQSLLQVCSDTSIDGAAAGKKGITFGGRTWITEGVSVYVYSNTAVLPTIDATITPAIPAGSIVDMAYDSNLDLVFFVYNDTSIPLSGGLRRIGTINPTTYAVTMNVAPAWSGAGYFATRIMVNPVTFEKYLDCADGNLYIADNGATITTVTAVPTGVVGVNFYANYGFNANTGDAWVLTGDSTSTNEIAVVNGTTYAITWVNATGIGAYKPNIGSAPYFAETVAYYPGDGTVGSDKMFVLYTTTAAPYNYIIQEFDATTFTDSTYLNEAVGDIAANISTIMYSTIYNKMVYTRNVSVHVYDPASSAVDFNSGLVLTAKGFNPQEDTVNDLIVMAGSLAGPSINYFWLCLDSANVTKCTEGVVDLYIGSNGPYQFNSTTNSWDNMCSPSAVTISASSFQANAIFTTNVTLAALLYSADAGVTWNAITDTSGNIYANPATWMTGRTYATPAGVFILKITFTTTDNCSFESETFIVV